MLKPFALAGLLTVALLIFSCKNESSQISEPVKEYTPSGTVQSQSLKRAPKKELTPEDRAMLESVMSRIMTEPQLKRFASYLVTAELANQLANPGPFTVFGPSNAALEAMPAEKKTYYSNTDNLMELKALLKSYIVEGNLDHQQLIMKIGSNGTLKLNTLSGSKLTVSKSGDQLMISDEKGNTATISSYGIEGSNGTLYVIDSMVGHY